jgi:hypothetical protein
MTSTFRTQLWVAFKIWLLAVLINTLAGTLYLANVFHDGGLLPLLLIFGSIMGLLYSLPVFVLLLLIINRCVAKSVNGDWIFRATFLSAALLTAVTWGVFNTQSIELGLIKNDIGLLVISLFAAMGSVALQFKSLYKLAKTADPVEEFLTDTSN